MKIEIDMKEILSKVYRKDTDDKSSYWDGTRYDEVRSRTPKQKGHIGEYIVKQILEDCGRKVEIIDDQGDLLIDSEVKSEVKYSTQSGHPTKKGKLRIKLWWNQIRPNQPEWGLLHLVAVFPESLVVWEIPRADFEDLLRSESPIFDGLSHKGTDEMVSISLTKNSKTDTYKLLDKYLIFKDGICNHSQTKEHQEKNSTIQTAA